MLNFLLRILRSVLVLLGVGCLIFALIRLAPGDPVTLLAGPTADIQTVEALRIQLGLDQSMGVQLLKFLSNALRGDLGESLVHRRPVLDLILYALPQTVYLSICALLIALLVSVPAGLVSALRPSSAADRLAEGVVLAAQSVPVFWVSILLIQLFAVRLGWLPSSGNDQWAAVILPAFALSILQWPLLTKTVRTAAISVGSQDYAKTALAKGLSSKRIVFIHLLRNMLVPIVTIIGLQTGAMLSGSVVTEAVFAWPGIGTLAMASLLARDYPTVQGIVLFSAAIVVTISIVADALSLIIDPRLRS